MDRRFSGLDTVALPGPNAWRDGAFARDVAALCARLPWRAGNRVLVVSDDAYALAVGLFGALHSDLQVLLPANLQPGHIGELVATADGAIFAGVKMGGLGIDAVPALAANPPTVLPPLRPLDVATAKIILHTSGSTGGPQAVEKSLRCLDAEIAVQELAFGDRVAADVLATVPPYHIYGLLFRVLWPLASGRSLDCSTIIYPEQIVEHARRLPGVALISSPAFLRRALPVLDLDTLRDRFGQVFSSGGPLPPEIASAYNAKLQQPIIEIYGSTETGGIAYRSVLDADNPPAWMPLPKVEVAIDPTDGALSVRSPFLSEDGWFRTADLAAPRGGGFDLRGRNDRVVKLQEQRVSLSEVERRLAACSDVAEVRVVPVRTGTSGRQALAAVIQPTAGGWERLSETGKWELTNALTEAIRPFLHSSALPRRWRFVRHLPVEVGGKTTEARLLTLFGPEAGRNTAPAVLDESREEDTVRLQLRLPEDLFYFQGHFDDAPILPGVVQVDWAMRFAAERLGITPILQRIEVLKFFDVLTRNREVRLTLDYDAERNRLTFTYEQDGRKYSSGRLILGVAS